MISGHLNQVFVTQIESNGVVMFLPTESEIQIPPLVLPVL